VDDVQAATGPVLRIAADLREIAVPPQSAAPAATSGATR
jgi:hypothetical protein